MRVEQGRHSPLPCVAAWWYERVTAVALVPLTLWFASSLIALAGMDHATVVASLKRPLTALLMMLQLAVLFSHLALGLRVIIEDYVQQPGLRVALVLGNAGFALLVAAFSAWALLRLAFGG